MSDEKIERVGVLGTGLMGSGIVHVCAQAGYEVVGFDIDERRLALIPDEVLLNELKSYKYRSGRHVTQYEAPAGRHDDTVIALALAWQIANQPRLAFGIVEV